MLLAYAGKCTLSWDGEEIFDHGVVKAVSTFLHGRSNATFFSQVTISADTIFAADFVLAPSCHNLLPDFLFDGRWII